MSGVFERSYRHLLTHDNRLLVDDAAKYWQERYNRTARERTLSARERTLSGMENRARGRLDYNESRSGYAAPATELALYVLILARCLREWEKHDG